LIRALDRNLHRHQARDCHMQHPQIAPHDIYLSGNVNLMCAESTNNKADYAIAVPE